MKTCVVILLFVLLAVGVLYASSGDKAVNYVLSQGSFETNDGELYFNHLSCEKKDNPLTEKDALVFMAQTAYVFLMVETGWVEFDSVDTANIKDVDYIACPLEKRANDKLGVVSMASIRELVSQSQLESLGDPECFGLIFNYVSKHALEN